MTGQTDTTERPGATRWIYQGIWRVLVDFFDVPPAAPALPSKPGDEPDAFKPALAFLRYCRMWFWIVAVLFDLGLLVAWIAIAANELVVALILLPLFLLVAIVPDIIFYIAIHLRYDTTWYVMTKRSVRIRRGVWVIHETTITFENVQNVSVRQGPVQRAFGIANVIIETAGGGGGDPSKGGAVASRGVIEGIENATEIRDVILARLRASKRAGLGDEDRRPTADGWTPAHIEVLGEIRAAVNALRPG